jgi:hypothetical protein
MSIQHHAAVNETVYHFARGYLDRLGWFASLDGTPRDHAGYVPYITYPALRQLARLIRPEFRVFEYGCGGSSLWWATRVAEVISVEHDAGWAERVAAAGGDNLRIITRERGAALPPKRRALLKRFLASGPELPLSHDDAHNVMHGLMTEDFAAYATEIEAHGEGGFDVIVVDGMARCFAAWLAPRHLKAGGFLVFDNADRWHYNAAYRQLREAGFHRIDFYGPGPVNRIEWCTAIFTRDLSAFSANVERAKGEGDLGW